jgi:hypothetical protein
LVKAPCGRGGARMGAAYQSLPTGETKPKDPGAPSTRTLPRLTMPPDQTKIQVVLHVEPLPILTNCIAILCSRCEPIGGFGLVRGPLTRCYQPTLLARPPFYYTITNHYQPRVKYTHNDRNSHILYSDSGPTRIRLIPTASTQEVIVVGDGGAQHRSVDPPTDIPQCCRSPGRTRIHTVARTPHPTTRPIWAYDCEHTGEANYFGKDFLRMAGIVQMLHGHDSRRDI